MLPTLHYVRHLVFGIWKNKRILNSVSPKLVRRLPASDASLKGWHFAPHLKPLGSESLDMDLGCLHFQQAARVNLRNVVIEKIHLTSGDVNLRNTTQVKLGENFSPRDQGPLWNNLFPLQPTPAFNAILTHDTKPYTQLSAAYARPSPAWSLHQPKFGFFRSPDDTLPRFLS